MAGTNSGDGTARADPTGENSCQWLAAARRSSSAPIGIAIADALMGEIPAMA